MDNGPQDSQLSVDWTLYTWRGHIATTMTKYQWWRCKWMIDGGTGSYVIRLPYRRSHLDMYWWTAWLTDWLIGTSSVNLRLIVCNRVRLTHAALFLIKHLSAKEEEEDKETERNCSRKLECKMEMSYTVSSHRQRVMYFAFRDNLFVTCNRYNANLKYCANEKINVYLFNFVVHNFTRLKYFSQNGCHTFLPVCTFWLWPFIIKPPLATARQA